MPRSSKNCGNFITSTKGGDCFFLISKSSLDHVAWNFFSIVKWWIFTTKKIKKSLVNTFYLFKHYLLDFLYYIIFIAYFQNLGIFRLRQANFFFWKNLIISARLVNHQSCIKMVCIEPHFITFVVSNTKWSSVKLCAWCI